MGGGTIEVHRDSEPFAFGTHTGPYGSTDLIAKGKDFKSCGVQVGVLIKNLTSGGSGITTAVTETNVSSTMDPASVSPLIDADGLFVYDSDGEQVFMQPEDDSVQGWNRGDEYEIYTTATEDSVISSTWVDRRYGRPTDMRKLKKGIRNADLDRDEYSPNIFGPGQPSNSRRYP